ncbi:MAG: 50S ribosomal protein L4 [Candidatus Paracaedibacteraceae bacterium]|jgi:large subunit ribosomal protein L4|nr:50S ribosomal protein L4 [Candidatus Paracaedibacteraceae bacterium]
MKIDVVNIEAKKAGNIELNPEIFGLQPRVDILSRVIEWQLSKRRSGNHKTKEVGDVKGSTKKIYRQKGTGNARHGSKRQVQFRGGCVAFGPVVRSHAYSLPKKVRKLGLKIALSAKAQAGELLVVDTFKVESGKTKDLLKVISTLNTPSALLIDSIPNSENPVVRAAANLEKFDVLPHNGANVYDIMRKEKLIVTKEAVKALEERLK